MVDAAHEIGLDPIVTLMHFTVPRWFERDGFWRAPDAADLFARYTELALPIVSDGVDYVCTIAGDDFVGVQAYTRTFIGPNGPLPVSEDVETTLTGWEFYPPAAAEGVRSAWALSGGVPVMITENGIATSDDTRRIAYTEAALRELHATIDDGIRLEGYLHWSALDNYEWASGYRPTFGLIAVDRETFVRTPKPSLAWLGSVARANGL